MDDTTSPRRGHLRAVGWTKVGHGLFRPRFPAGAAGAESAGPHPVGSSTWLVDLRAWALVLPPSGGFTHLTAAALYAWWLPPVPRGLPVFVSVSGRESRPRRQGLIASRRDHCHPPMRRRGLPVDLPAEVLLRAARDLALLDLVVLVDAALRCGDCHREHPQEADATLGRPHRPWRLRPWYAMLRASSLTPAGTGRLAARWNLRSRNCQKAA